MVLLALAMPRRFERLMTTELKRRQLGPFGELRSPARS
jgi:hypothetical protein